MSHARRVLLGLPLVQSCNVLGLYIMNDTAFD